MNAIVTTGSDSSSAFAGPLLVRAIFDHRLGERFYIIFLKAFLWTALSPLALLGMVQMTTFRRILMNRSCRYTAAHWLPIKKMMVMQRPLLGMNMYRSTGPFMQCIMYGWFFAIWVTPGTNLLFEKAASCSPGSSPG